jgi:hypothetical protein
LRVIAAEDGYFNLTTPDATNEWLPSFFERSTDFLAAGHTHAAKAHLVGGRGLYVNTGTWARLLRLPASDDTDETWVSFINNLRDGEDLGTSRPTFAHVYSRNGSFTRANLISWEGGQPVDAARFEFITQERGWREVEVSSA